jgi:hypothetical protein
MLRFYFIYEFSISHAEKNDIRDKFLDVTNDNKDIYRVTNDIS